MATQPDFKAYTVIKREGAEDFWLPIGAAFIHQDGTGYNVVLQALPIDGKIVLRLPRSEDQPVDTGASAAGRADNRNPSATKRR